MIFQSPLIDYSYLANQPKQHDHTVGQGVFWVYGDSLSYYFYESITSPMRRLCFSVFKECNNTYNWIYPKTLYELVSVISRWEITDCEEGKLN